jgi:WD40 repeat protein
MKQLEIWNISTGTIKQVLTVAPDHQLRNIAYDESGQYLFAGYINPDSETVGWARWDLTSGEITKEFSFPSLGETYPACLDVVSNRLALGFDQALLMFNITGMQHTVSSQFGTIVAVAFDPSGTRLAVANIRGRIKVWHAPLNQLQASLELPMPFATAIDLAFSTDGSLLVASHPNLIQIWNLESANEKTEMAGHQAAIPAVAFHPQGTVLASGGKDKVVRFWNPQTGDPIGSCEIGEPIEKMAYTADGRWLALACMGKKNAPHLRIIDTQSNKVALKAAPPMGEVLSLKWSSDGTHTYLAGGGEQGLEVWKFIGADPPELQSQLQLSLKNNVRYLSVEFNIATNVLVGADDKRFKAWHPRTGEAYRLDAPHLIQGWHSLALLPDGQSILFVSEEGLAEIWNIKTNSRVKTIGDPKSFNASNVALTADGQWLAALVEDDVASVWNVSTGKHLLTLRTATGAIWALAWDRAGENLAVGQSDGGLSVWHLPKIQEKLKQEDLSW